MSQKIITLFFTLVVFFCPLFSQDISSLFQLPEEQRMNLIIAVVGDQPIFYRDITSELKKAEEFVSQEEHKKHYQKYIKLLIQYLADQKLLIQQATHYGLSEDSSFQTVAYEIAEQKVDNYISPHEIAQFYKNHQQQFSKPKKIKTRIITLFYSKNGGKEQCLAKANTIIQKLRKGEDFGELARLHSEDPFAWKEITPEGPKEGGAWPRINRDGVLIWDLFGKGEALHEEAEEIAFSMEHGQISEPICIDSQEFCHIIKVEAVKPAVLIPFQEVYAKIYQSMFYEKVLSEVTRITGQLRKNSFVWPADLFENEFKPIFREPKSFKPGKVEITGNNHIDKDEILRILDLSKYSTLELYHLEAACFRLRKACHKMGFVEADVTVQTKVEDGSLNANFMIKEGKILVVSPILLSFKGNDVFSDDILLALANLQDTDTEIDEKKIKTLLDGYRSKGFFDVAITGETKNFVEVPGTVDIPEIKIHQLQIKIEIHEGARYKVRQIQFTGTSEAEEKELRDLLTLREGNLFDDSKLQEDKARLEHFYQNKAKKYLARYCLVIPEPDVPVTNIRYSIAIKEEK